MGPIGIIVLIIGISFVGVTVMGWDAFLELVEDVGVRFQEFVSSGFVELQERI